MILNKARARDIFEELIEINTTESHGNTTAASEAMAKRLRRANEFFYQYLKALTRD